jgi:hypothetical protein
MKTLLIILALSSFIANGQLVVKEAAKDTTIWQASKLTTVPKIIRFGSGETKSYSIFYRNAQYTTITDIDYISMGDLETTIQFFELCQSVINEDKEYNLELDGKNILLKKSMGSAWIWMNGSYFYLTTKNLTAILESLK